MLPAWPGSQSGVSLVTLGLGLGPPSGGQVGPVVRRLRGVSMEVDHPAGGSRGRRVRLHKVSSFICSLHLPGSGFPPMVRPRGQGHPALRKRVCGGLHSGPGDSSLGT